MDRIIIENQTDKPLHLLLPYVAAVIQKGRISDFGKSYCYCTSFYGSPNIYVYAVRNKKSDRFIIANRDQEPTDA